MRSSSSAISDRKSTRLNSSHLVISYPVFCLKKKKCGTQAADCLSLADGLATPSTIGKYARDPHHRLPYVQGWNVDFLFFNDTATTEIYTLSLHDALPICGRVHRARGNFVQRPHHDRPRPKGD